MWVTDDEKRIPVKVESSTPLGPIDAMLISFTQGTAGTPTPAPK